jgi:hypothetical protein
MNATGWLILGVFVVKWAIIGGLLLALARAERRR